MIGLFLTFVVCALLLAMILAWGCGRGNRISGTSWFDLPMVPLNRAGRRATR